MLSKLPKYSLSYANKFTSITRSRFSRFARTIKRFEHDVPKESKPLVEPIKPIKNPPPPPQTPPDLTKKKKSRWFRKSLYALFLVGAISYASFFTFNTYFDLNENGVSAKILKYGSMLKFLTPFYDYASTQVENPNWGEILQQLLTNTNSRNLSELEGKLSVLFGKNVKIDQNKPESLKGFGRDLPLIFYLAILHERFGIHLASVEIVEDLESMLGYCVDKNGQIQNQLISDLYYKISLKQPEQKRITISEQKAHIKYSDKNMLRFFIRRLMSHDSPSDREIISKHLKDINSSLNLTNKRTDYGDNFVLQNKFLFCNYNQFEKLMRPNESHKEPQKKVEPQVVQTPPPPVQTPPQEVHKPEPIQHPKPKPIVPQSPQTPVPAPVPQHKQTPPNNNNNKNKDIKPLPYLLFDIMRGRF